MDITNMIKLDFKQDSTYLWALRTLCSLITFFSSVTLYVQRKSSLYIYIICENILWRAHIFVTMKL